MQYIYFKTTSGRLMTNVDIVDAALIVHDERISREDYESIREYARTNCAGILEEVTDEVTVDYLVQNGHRVKAIELYYNINRENGVTLSESRRIIEKMIKEFKSNQ